MSKVHIRIAALGLLWLTLCPSTFGQSYNLSHSLLKLAGEMGQAPGLSRDTFSQGSRPPGKAPEPDWGGRFKYETSSYVPPSRKGSPVWRFLTASLAWVSIIGAFVAVIGSLARVLVGNAISDRLDGIQNVLRRLTLWPRQFDPLVVTGSILASFLLIWLIPHVGLAGRVFFFGLVVPLAAFTLTWQLLGYFRRHGALTADLYKRLAVSLTAALILLQFGFESWGYVLLKLIVMIAISSFFLRDSSLLSYRLFLIPAAFAFPLAINRLFGSEPALYLFVLLGLNGVIIFLALKSFMETSGNAPERFLPEWNQLVKVCRTLIGSDGATDSTTASESPAKAYSPPGADHASTHEPHSATTASDQVHSTNSLLSGRRYFHTDGKEVFGPLEASAILQLESSRSITQDTLICEEGLEEWTKLSDSPLAPHLPKRPKPPEWASSSVADPAKQSLSFWTPRWASIPCVIFLVLTFLEGTEKTNSRVAGTAALVEGLDYSRSRQDTAAFTILSFLAGDASGVHHGLNQIKRGDARAISRLQHAQSNITQANESHGALFTLSLLFGFIWLGMQAFVRLKRKSLPGTS